MAANCNEALCPRPRPFKPKSQCSQAEPEGRDGKDLTSQSLLTAVFHPISVTMGWDNSQGHLELPNHFSDQTERLKSETSSSTRDRSLAAENSELKPDIDATGCLYRLLRNKHNTTLVNSERLCACVPVVHFKDSCLFFTAIFSVLN